MTARQKISARIDAGILKSIIVISLSLSALVPAAHAAPVAQSGLQPGLWENRRAAVKDLLAPSISIPASSLNSASVLPQDLKGAAGFLPTPLHNLPFQYGEIVEVNVSHRPEAPFVLLVQDARKSVAAQRGIAGALTHIQSHMEAQRLFVGLEGFEGRYDINLYRAQRDNLAQREVWNELLGKSLISGAEYFGLTAKNEPILWGSENNELYKKSFDAFQYGPETEKDARRWIEAMRADLERVKMLIYGDELLQLDALTARFESGEAGPGELLKFLKGMPEISKGKYPEIEKYLALMQAEKEFGAEKVKAEREKIMKALASKLKPADLQQLVELSFAYRVGRIGAVPYNAYIKSKIQSAGLDLKQYPAFSGYMQYSLMAERINPNALTAGIRSLAGACAARLATTADQRQAVELTSLVRKVQKLVTLGFTAEEWQDYNRSREKIAQLPVSVLILRDNVERRYRGLASLPRNAAAKKPAVSNLSGYAELLAAYEGFYAAIAPRRQALVHNFTREVSQQAPAELSVLVTGGYHTAAIAESLAARGISYAIFRPRL